MCAYIDFDDPNLKLDHFTEYLVKNEIPSGGKTYYEFFSDFQTSPDVIDEASQGTQDTIYTDQEYMILYTHYTQGYYNEYMKTSSLIGAAVVGEGVLVLSAAGTVAGPVIIAAGAAIVVVGLATYVVKSITGTQDWHSSVEIVNTQMIDSLNCEYLPIRTEE